LPNCFTMTPVDLIREGYIGPMKMEDGRIAAVIPCEGGAHLCLGNGTVTLYTYRLIADAIRAMEAWDGQGDPPGRWADKQERKTWL